MTNEQIIAAKDAKIAELSACILAYQQSLKAHALHMDALLVESKFLYQPAAAVSAPTDERALVDAIFAMRSSAPKYNNLHVISAYNDGHYDARVAAIELVNTHFEAIAARAAAPVSGPTDA